MKIGEFNAHLYIASVEGAMISGLEECLQFYKIVINPYYISSQFPDLDKEILKLEKT